MLTLYYVADPMCSWCYGFAPEWEQVRSALPSGTTVRIVMGGLAPDSEAPMPEAMRQRIEATWRLIAETTGVSFNHDFWTVCTPRRSTLDSCRAVLAAGLQGRAEAMFAQIQHAYYQEAKNPADRKVLLDLGASVPGLDATRFARDVSSGEVETLLRRDLALRDELGVRGFPALVAERASARRCILQGYASAAEVLGRV